MDSSVAVSGPQALVYNSNTVNVLPILQATFTSDANLSVPTQLQAQLTWNNGMPQSWVTFSTTGHSAGDTYLMDLQVANAVTAGGNFPWKIEVQATFTGGDVIDRTLTGIAQVQVNGSSSPFGPGWSLAGLDKVITDTNGVTWVYGSGGTQYFQLSGSTYISPPNLFGTLTLSGGVYTYTDKSQVKWNFNSSTGLLTSITDPHGLAVSFAYSGNNPSTITYPDGGVATFVYTGSLVTAIQEPGSRTVTLTYNGSNQLTGITDPDGTIDTFSYDGSNRLTKEVHGPVTATFAYNTIYSTASSVDIGGGSTLSLTPANIQGFATSPGKNASAAVGVATDARSNVTTYTMDTLGRLTKMQTPDGAVQSNTLDFAGQVTAATDPLNHTTKYAYQYGSGKGDLAQVTNADGSTEKFQYNQTFHTVTQDTDARNNATTFAYDATTGDLLTTKNALNQVTTNTWSGGLLQTTTDALGHTVTNQWDSTKRRLTDTIDALGNHVTYGYDAAGNQTTVQDSLGHTTTTVYDAMRRPTQVTDAAGGVVTMAYNALGEMTSQTDQLGHVTNYTFDQHGWQTVVVAAAGTSVQTTTTTAYDVNGNVLSVTDPLGHVVSYAYDALNRQTQQIDAYGTGLQRTTTTAYDLAGRVLSVTDPLGRIVSYAYDSLNRQTQQIEAYGTSLQRTTTTAYDLAGNVQSTTDQLAHINSFAYDALNRQAQQIEAYGTSLQRTTTTAYDLAGNVLSVTDPLAHVVSYAYDSLNRQTQVIEAYGTSLQRTTTTAYDLAGNVLSTTDPLGHINSFAYDALNRRTQTIDAFGTSLQRTTTTAYDLAGNVRSVTDPVGAVSSYAYDALNRRTQQVDAYGTGLQRTTTTVYDGAGNVVQAIDALNFTTTYGFDALNRRITVQTPTTGVTTTTYDAGNNVVNTVDALGNKSTFVYDALNRKTQTIDAKGGATTTVYDADNNTVNIIDSVGNKTTFVFDALNRRTQQTDPLGHAATFAFDADNNLTSSTDRNARVRNLSYDALNRKTGETWVVSGTTANTLTFTYDAADNRLTAADAQGTYTMAYDALNRMTSQTGLFAVTLTFTYDAGNNRTQVQDSLGGTTTSVYDALHRLTSRQFGGAGQTPLRLDLTYTTRDQIASETRYSDLGGTQKIGSTSFTYDAEQRLTNLQHLNSTGSNLANYTYTYDLGDRLTQETLNGTITTYSYDVTNQLTNDSRTTYTYDNNGNRTMTGYSTGTGNQLTSDGTWNYTYDNEGNEVTKTNISTSEKWTFGYDTNNRLVSAVDANSLGTTLATDYLAYDVFGNRIEQDTWTQSSGTTVTRFAYDGQNVLADLSSTNALQTRYMRGDAPPQLFARISSGGVAAWYLTDRVGSVRDLTDNTGAVQDHIDYNGFGNITTETHPAFSDRFKFQGMQFQAPIGLYGTWTRFYDPTTGRWISQDPIGFLAGDANIYRYAGNNPQDSVDPTGMFGIPVIPGLILPIITSLSNINGVATDTIEWCQNAPCDPQGLHKKEGKVFALLIDSNVPIGGRDFITVYYNPVDETFKYVTIGSGEVADMEGGQGKWAYRWSSGAGITRPIATYAAYRYPYPVLMPPRPARWATVHTVTWAWSSFRQRAWMIIAFDMFRVDAKGKPTGVLIPSNEQLRVDWGWREINQGTCKRIVPWIKIKEEVR